jgi:hypothetical protein
VDLICENLRNLRIILITQSADRLEPSAFTFEPTSVGPKKKGAAVIYPATPFFYTLIKDYLKTCQNPKLVRFAHPPSNPAFHYSAKASLRAHYSIIPSIPVAM